MPASRLLATAAIAAALSLPLGCSKPAEPEPGKTSASAEPAKGPREVAPQKVTGAPVPNEVVWEAPAAWTKVESKSPMRKATYKIPKAEGDAEDGELTVTQAGGSLESNIARWAGQLAAKPDAVTRTSEEHGGLKVTVVEMKGTYTGMAMPGSPPAEPKPNYALLGAIAETGIPTFFKLTGPEKTVAAAKADFSKLVASLHAK